MLYEPALAKPPEMAFGAVELPSSRVAGKRTGGTAMKTSWTMLVLVLLLLSIQAGCAPGANPFMKMATGHIAGFWLGLWQGFIAPFVFVASLFKADLNVYEVHNNGPWYNFGYLIGLACFFGRGRNRTSQRYRKSNHGAGAKIDD
jgi:hypothetical protein